LFIEETTKAVLEAVTADGGDNDIAAIPTSSVPVPASLHASLMARLDRLGPAKSVAQLAAVIGREFSHALLNNVASEPEAVPPHATYLFDHALVQDAAYQSLLKSRRQLHHARIADVLEAQSSAAVAPEPIAYHLTEAGRIEQAIEYWLKAGQ